MDNDSIIEIAVDISKSILLDDATDNPDKVSNLIREIYTEIKRLNKEDATS